MLVLTSRGENFIDDVEVPQQKYEFVYYDIESARALEHASIVVHDFIRRASENPNFPEEGWKNDSEDTCSRAEKILKDAEKRDRSATLVLYEIAAAELYNRSAVAGAVDILSGEEKSADAAKRAIGLLERFCSYD